MADTGKTATSLTNTQPLPRKLENRQSVDQKNQQNCERPAGTSQSPRRWPCPQPKAPKCPPPKSTSPDPPLAVRMPTISHHRCFPAQRPVSAPSRHLPADCQSGGIREQYSNIPGTVARSSRRSRPSDSLPPRATPCDNLPSPAPYAFSCGRPFSLSPCPLHLPPSLMARKSTA